MRRGKRSNRNERGAAFLEFAISALVYLTSLFAVLDFGRLLWTHNALGDAVRLGARYAVYNPTTSTAQIKNVVVYGNSAGGTSPIVYGLTLDRVDVAYSNAGLNQGRVTVRVSGYNFAFATALFGASIQLPEYRTALTCESMGFTPPNI